MSEFGLALAAFLAAHSVPAAPRLRSRLIGRFGRHAYLSAYSAVSLILLVWLTAATHRADTVPLWQPARWQWCVPLAAMPFALFLIVAGLLEPNPLSVTLRVGDEPGSVVAITRHPVLWGFLLWAASHIPPNGDLVSVVLFGTMATFSLAGLVLLDAKARRRLGPKRWQAISRTTSVVPFAALLAGRTTFTPSRRSLLAAALALSLYAWFLAQGHALLIGPDPLSSLHALD
ncbi:NnrU family protein [Methylobacterium sp. P31]